MKKISNRVLNIIYITFLVLIAVVCLLHFVLHYSTKYLISLLGCLVLVFCFFFMKKKFPKVFKGKNLKIIVLVFFVIGTIIRVYLIYALDYHLVTDFQLYYQTAVDLVNNLTRVSATEYLTYNGYVCVYSSILALFMKIFGASIKCALVFNLICQLATCFVLYKIFKYFKKDELAIWAPCFWFMMPNVIFTNSLIITENFYILLLVLAFYFILKLKDIPKPGIKHSWLFALFGLFLAFGNYIRPIMVILLLAYGIFLFFEKKSLWKWLSYGIVCIFFVIGNFLANIYVEDMLGQSTRSGASQWAIFYGANLEEHGIWNYPDNLIITETLAKESGADLLLEMALERYRELGIFGSAELFAKKYYALWSDHLAGYHYMLQVTTTSFVDRLLEPLEMLNMTLLLILIYYNISLVIKNFKLEQDNCLLYKLFGVIYILGNFLVVVNGRYNYPILIILVLMLALNEKSQTNKV